MIKNIITGVIAVILAVVISLALVGNNQPNLKGTTNYDDIDVSDGYAVDGTTVIDGSGNVDAPITSTTGTFSSTLNATGATTLGTLTQGGGIRATSTVNSAETLLAADFDVEDVIAYTLNVQDATLTLPATSTLSSFIATAGQTRTIFIRNATTTAAMDLTLAGGTGMNLITASSTKAIVGGTAGANSARLDFARRADTDIDVTMSIFLK